MKTKKKEIDRSCQAIDEGFLLYSTPINMKDGKHHLSVHIMQLLVALDAEVLVTKHSNPAAFGVLLFSVLVITMRLLFCFCTMESLCGLGGSGGFLVCCSQEST